MPILNIQNLETPEGTIEFKFTPTSIGTKKTDITDLISPRTDGRILLSLEATNGAPPILELKVYSPNQELFSKGKPLMNFRIGERIHFVITWSSTKHEVIVYINGKEFLKVENFNITF
ncbi:hypothetical protein KAT95_02440 [Candidatus Parcubacteria bacterium]|nr:hypothetical protein [Candidatus Parcubacteria bacterium]